MDPSLIMSLLPIGTNLLKQLSPTAANVVSQAGRAYAQNQARRVAPAPRRAVPTPPASAFARLSQSNPNPPAPVQPEKKLTDSPLFWVGSLIAGGIVLKMAKVI